VPCLSYTPRVSRRTATLVILLLAVLPALVALHSRSFFSPDETSYAQVTREMLETHDFVVPTIDGRPWLEKPPLVYWLLAGAFGLFGWGFPAAVLLNALLTAGTALVIAAHVRRNASPRAALLAAIAYLSMFLPLAAARSALTDPALTLCTTGAIALFLVEGWPAAIGSGVLLGLGVLAKGPVAPLVVVPALIVVAVAERRAARWRRLGAALAAAAVVALPWHLLLAARGLWPEFSAVFFEHQVLSRAVEVWGFRAPWWFYLPALWLAAFPWGTHVAFAFRDLARRLRHDRRLVAEVTAVAVPLVAFSLAANKLPHYLLPLVPWLAVWLGRAADDLLDRPRPDRFTRATAWSAALIGAGALAAAAALSTRADIGRFLPSATPWMLAAAALVFAALAVVEARGAIRFAWAGLCLLGLATRLGLDVSLLPVLDRQTLERPLAAAVREHFPTRGLPIAHRWWRASFVAYGLRGWTRTDTEGQLAAALASAASQGRPALVLVRADSEGEGRAAAWNTGGVAHEAARVSGLGEIDGKVLEGIVFLVDRQRDGTRVFYDADRALPGEAGFAAMEGNTWTPSFRWSVAASSRLPLAANPPADAVLRLRAWGRAHQGHPQRLRLLLNDCSLGELTLTSLPEVYTLRVPAGCLHEAPQELAFTASHLDVPRESDPASSDARTLAFALDWLALDPAPVSEGKPHSETSR
jgi:4-amino-4-deoxy-L-arabinose transferase-like glycosyltransferase